MRNLAEGTADGAQIWRSLLLLPAPDCSGRKPAETLARPRRLAESAGNLQRILAIRGANPRIFRFRSSQFAANQQPATSVPPGQPGLLVGAAYWRAPARPA